MYRRLHTAEEFQYILEKFSEAFRNKQYTRRIPYTTWKKIFKSDGVEIMIVDSDFTIYGDGDSEAEDGFLYEDKIYDNGLGSFYWDNYINLKQENDTMTTNLPSMNFDFGPCTENVAISPYGMAVQTKEGRFLTYDAKNGKTIDVTGFTFHFKNTIYKMPAAIKDLRPGAMVLHQGKPMYVTSIENGVEVVDILASEAKTILPVSNMFGFDYVTTIVSFMNFDTATPTNDNPFGNLMPFMMAQMIFGEDGGFENMDFSKMMMFSMMTGQQNPFFTFFNPNKA